MIFSYNEKEVRELKQKSYKKGYRVGKKTGYNNALKDVADVITFIRRYRNNKNISVEPDLLNIMKAFDGY